MSAYWQTYFNGCFDSLLLAEKKKNEEEILNTEAKVGEAIVLMQAQMEEGHWGKILAWRGVTPFLENEYKQRYFRCREISEKD